MNEIEGIWDLMSSDYEAFTDTPDSYSNEIEWPCIRSLLPDLKDRRVLDVGCGTGRFTHYLAGYGPGLIIGTDISGRMLDLAGAKQGEGSIISFFKCSAEELESSVSGVFDFVFSSTASHYFSDLKTAFKGIYNVLADNGVFLLSAMHPVYTASYPVRKKDEWVLRYLSREVREYEQPWTKYGKSHTHTQCRSYHYTVSDYLNSLISLGFTIDAVEEPGPPDRWKKAHPERYEATVNEPLYLVIKCRK